MQQYDPQPCFFSSEKEPAYLSPLVQRRVPSIFQLLSNLPSNCSPDLQTILPFPWRFPFTKVPSQVKLVVSSFPFPFIMLFENSPSHFTPLAKTIFPYPLFMPFPHYPSQLSPFAYSSNPLPCFKFPAQPPLQISPFEKQKVPSPSLFQFFTSPSYLSFVASISIPSPKGWSFCHSPRQISPLAFSQTPVPFLLFPKTSPWYWDPSSYSFWTMLVRNSPDGAQMQSFRKDSKILFFSYQSLLGVFFIIQYNPPFKSWDGNQQTGGVQIV